MRRSIQSLAWAPCAAVWLWACSDSSSPAPDPASRFDPVEVPSPEDGVRVDEPTSEPESREDAPPADVASEPVPSTEEGNPEPSGGVAPGAVETGGNADGESEPEPPAEPMPDRCDVGVDPGRPPEALPLSGNLGAHDPVIIPAHGRYYYFSTGNGVAAKVSDDLLDWQGQPSVFDGTPDWFTEAVPAYQPRNVWAPDVAYFGDLYHLYYSVSSFGSNRSCIGHATRARLDEGSWTDHEAVVCSNQPGESHDYNAIDANVVIDEQGVPWMSFGSFWSGIKMVRLTSGGERADDEVYDLASRGGGSIEAPFIVRRCGFYYLFVSFGRCCQGADSTYNVNVGRADGVLGPYVDREGTPLMEGGGTRIVEAGDGWVGPGHNAVLIDGEKAYNVYHAYSAQNGASRLRISELFWDAEGWPVSGGP